MSIQFTPQILFSSTYLLNPDEEVIVERLKTDAKVLGVFLAFNTESEAYEPFYIHVRGDENKKTFCAIRLIDDVILGKVEAFPFRIHKGLFGNPVYSMPLSDPTGDCKGENYYGGDKFICKVFIDHLYTATSAPTNVESQKLFGENCRYKGIGAHLIYAIQSLFHSQFEGRMDVRAAFSSHGFYQKMGFSTGHAGQDAAIKSKTDAKEYTKNLGTIYMYLPKEISKAWLRIVTDHPFSIQQKENLPSQMTQIPSSTVLSDSMD